MSLIAYLKFKHIWTVHKSQDYMFYIWSWAFIAACALCDILWARILQKMLSVFVLSLKLLCYSFSFVSSHFFLSERMCFALVLRIFKISHSGNVACNLRSPLFSEYKDCNSRRNLLEIYPLIAIHIRTTFIPRCKKIIFRNSLRRSGVVKRT